VPCISNLDRISFLLSLNVLCVFRTVRERDLSHLLLLPRRARHPQTTIMSSSPAIQVRSFLSIPCVVCIIEPLFFSARPIGDLVLIHGAVLHKSKRNTSPRTRFAYTFHMIDSPPHAKYDDKNWLQPTKDMPFSKILVP